MIAADAPAICNLQSAICNLQSAICNLQSAICRVYCANRAYAGRFMDIITVLQTMAGLLLFIAALTLLFRQMVNKTLFVINSETPTKVLDITRKTVFSIWLEGPLFRRIQKIRPLIHQQPQQITIPLKGALGRFYKNGFSRGSRAEWRVELLPGRYHIQLCDEHDRPIPPGDVITESRTPLLAQAEEASYQLLFKSGLSNKHYLLILAGIVWGLPALMSGVRSLWMWYD
ncbi:hypothetical protein [Affinibrenneria salicis]|uniref:hypothetical protein n=1 Tax=Affinibrenneria salicis TaxID=2590031 RepID=UPI001CC75281|nr:hypothetical protein [Affinibrenneria salicis]